jgi:hypothetical protein
MDNVVCFCPSQDCLGRKKEGGLGGKLSMMDHINPWLIHHQQQKKDVKNKRFMLKDINTSMK